MPQTPTGKTTLLIASQALGRGDDQLGEALIEKFIYTLSTMEHVPDTIVFLNSGVKLVVRNSLVQADLEKLGSQGVRLLACGTCLEYFGLQDRVAVGQVSNMKEIAETLMVSDKVISL